ncbi:MAG: hypothetical protein HC877_10315 [Thioploca sp.]|nr:hypothetical protein [Thioploca sp.]
MRLLGEDTIHDHFVIKTDQLMLSNLNSWLRFILVLSILLWFSTSDVAAITVDTSLDDLTTNDNCTLREAISAAETTSNVDGCVYDNNIIDFDSRLAGRTINLTSTLTISKSLDIKAQNIIVNGGNNKQVFNIGSNIVVTIEGITITGGSSAGGGGISNQGDLTIINSTLRNNQSNTRGGAIYNANSGTLKLDKSLVYSNTTSGTASGGGIYNEGNMTIRNSTISSNATSSNNGGGIYNNGNLTISSSTITNNKALPTNNKQGGGISNATSGTVTVKNSIIAGNIAQVGSQDCRGTITSAGYNLMGKGCTPLTGTDIDFILPPTNGIIDNVFYSSTTPSGGVHLLKATTSNPTVNAIPNNVNDCGITLTQDQLGTPRPYPSPDATPVNNCDIGAYEIAPIIYHQIEVNPNAKEENFAGEKAFVITRYGGAINCATDIDYLVTGTATYDTDYQISLLRGTSIDTISGFFNLVGQDIGILKTTISPDNDPENDENIVVTLSNPRLSSNVSSECQNILNFFGGTSALQFLLSDSSPFDNISDTFTIVNDEIDNIAPSINSITITDPNPHTLSDVVNGITIEFSETVINFDLSELTLTRDSTAIPLTSAQTLTTSDGGKTWVLGNLTTLTATNGDYQLTVIPGDITDLAGNLLSSDKNIIWQKSLPTFSLTVTKSGSGNGTITVNGIDCGATCTNSYSSGTSINLTVTPDSHSIFTGWSGTDCSSSVTINADMTCTATFDPKPPPGTVALTILKTGTGGGTVSINGSACGNPCSQTYPMGSVITLTATPDTNSVFTGWSGTNCGSSVTINADMTCTAIFNSKPTSPSTTILTITKAGMGNGTISGSGINCGNTCSYTYSQGTAVTLTATPDGNSTFTGWSGTHCGSTFTITTSINCTATFAKKVADTLPTPPLPQTMTLTLSRQGSGQGEFEFSQNPQQTTCDDLETAQCTYQFPTATWVTVTAKVDSHSTFKGWRGLNPKCYQNHGEQLEFFMSENYSCDAEFEHQPPVLTLVIVGNGQILTSPTSYSIPCETGQCSQFAIDTEVTLTPQAGNGFHFDKWSGDPDCQAGQVKMDSDKTCVATFSDTPLVQLILSYDHNQGQIEIIPTGEDCGENCQRYYSGTPVTLTVQPQPGFQLAGWTGNCGNQMQTTLGMTLDKDFHCGVNFTTVSSTSPSPPALSTLIITLAGNELGTVTSIPPGINCGIDCMESYQTGTRVTLIATPTSSSTVVNWSDSCLSGQVSVEANKTCEVTFESTPEKILSSSTIQLAMPQYQINENGQGKVPVLVTRSGSEVGTVHVSFTTVNGTALANSDYTPLSGELTWLNGDTTPKTITVPILPDNLNEGSETFVIQLSNLTGEAQFGTYSQTRVTIVDAPQASNSVSTAPTESTGNDNVLPSPYLPPATSAGRIQFGVPVYEVMEQEALYPLEGFIKIPVFRLEGSQGEVAINYMTQDETAIAGKYYQQSKGQIVWADGEIGEKEIIVDDWDNKLPEEARSFRLMLSNPTNGAILGEYPDITVLIKDDEGSVVGFSPHNTYLAFEENQQAQITVSRSNSRLGEVTLRYTTIDGTAKAGENYVATSGTLTWGDGESQEQTIHIPLLSSLNKVGNKTFQLSLFEPTGQVTLATPSTVSVTIMTSQPNLCEIINNIVNCLIIREKDSPILENIHITSRGALIGSRLAGQIHNAGWLQNTLLLPNTTVTGGYISGSLSGQPEQPVTTLLRQVEVIAGTNLKYVGIGEGTQVNDQTHLGEGVCFEANDLIPNQNLSNLLGHTEQTVLGQSAVKLKRDVLCQSAIDGLLGAINDLPQLKNVGWELTQDPSTGLLNLAMENLHFATLPLQVEQVLTEEMVDELPLGITFPASGQVIFYTHTGRKIITYPVIQAPLALQAQLHQLGLNTVNLLANGNIEVPLANGSYFVARADLVAKRVSPERPIGLNYTTRPISLVFADETGNPWQQMLYPVAAYPEELDKLAASSPSTTRLTSTGQIKIHYKGYWYEGTLDYLVTPNQQSKASDLQWINTDDLNGDGCNDSWIYYSTGEKQALLKVCPRR